MLAVELHCHSALSHDGRDPVERLLQQAAKVGLDALAVTDHDRISASLKAVELAPEYGLLGVPGMEITTAAGHLLALGVEERIASGLTFEETIDRIHEAGGIAIVPHPFQEARHGVIAEIEPEQLLLADAIEIYNSRLITGRANRQAESFAAKHHMPTTGGSDAHVSEMVGQAITRVDTERNVDAILEAIKHGETTVEGRRTPWHISFRQAAGSAKRRMKDQLSSFLR